MKLEAEYNVKGYKLTYIKQENGWYLYEKTGRMRNPFPGAGNKPHWEVIKAIRNESRHPKGTDRPNDGWQYPSDKWWGQFGFTLMTRERAEEKFNEMINRDER